MSKKLKTNHVQVLLDDETLQQLNRLINIIALEESTKPKSTSSFVRDLIEQQIENYKTELHFYNKNTYKRANQL